MKTLKIIGLSLALILSSSGFAGAMHSKKVSEVGWEKLGMKSVDMMADHDIILVTAQEGFFTKVKLVIQKAPIHLNNMNIVFRNGDHENIVFDKFFEIGSSTRIIDLPGNKRIIKEIRLNYKSVRSGNGRALVTAWGKH